MAIKKALVMCVCVFVCIAKPVLAADEFSTSYDAQYTLTQTGETKVKQTIKTTNLIAESYVSSFTLDLGTQKVKDIKATDKTGELKTKYTNTASQSALLVEFKDKIVGKGSTRNFTIEYTSENVAQKQGTIYDVSIPKITGKGITDYAVTIIAGNNIGKPSSILPQPNKIEKKTDATHYSFTKEQLLKSGISFNFGEKQVYNMGLSYHLKNPQSRNVFTEIALPMNTANQTIVFDTITPQPESIYVDADGNYIAKYVLKPKQQLDVEFTGKAIVSLNKNIPDEPLIEEQRELYTRPQKYWETDDTQIASLAASLKTPEKIYQYVVDTLQYNSSRLQSDQYTRKGAVAALQSTKDSVCMEFTDLFIAIARSAGIPAREVNGYGYANDKSSRPLSLSQDVLHSWPEYWDEEKGWIPVDPTWENTTKGTDYFNVFDLNHIAFVRKGVSSETPYPAGSYKGTDAVTRDVIVNFTENDPELKTDLQIDTTNTNQFIGGTDVHIPIIIKNNGNTTFQKQAGAILSYNDQKYTYQKNLIIPPGATYDWKLDGLKTEILSNDEGSLFIELEDNQKQIDFKIIPFFLHSYFFIGAIYLLGIPIACYFMYRLLHNRDMKKRMVK